MHPVLVVLIIVAFAAAAYYFHRLEQQRREALLLWATRQGFDFDPAKRKGLHERWAGLKVLRHGHSQSGRNFITGRRGGRDFTLCDFQYVTGSGKNRQTHRRGLVILQTDHPTIPLQVRRENPFDKVGEFLGMDDIDFESAEFSRKFFVKSSDRKWAYDVIHARTMDYLLREAFQEFEFGFSELCVIRNGRHDPRSYEETLRFAEGLLDLVPDYVVKQMKGSR
jgi:hypothetical protein